MPAVSTFSPTGNTYLDGMLTGTKWATDTLTFSFPTDPSYYGSYGSEPTTNFGAFSLAQQAAMRDVLEVYSSVANLNFVEVTETATQHGDLRLAESDATSTAWGYYPSTSAKGGDAWFNKSTSWYDSPVKGDYGWLTYMHEVGHTLGLKHPHTASGLFPAMSLEQDSMEFTVMSYRSYVGASTTTGYANEGWGYAQSLMMNDIAAIQHLYGANYSTNAGETVYTWSSTTGEMFINGVGQGAPAANRIFLTVWDGGGADTYDFSNYSTNLKVDLQPGGWTTTSAEQLAYLGGGTYARGNIANALLYNNNPASLIENAKGGSGSDEIVGNIANNTLVGNGGNDKLCGLAGADMLAGGAGEDILDGGTGSDTALDFGLASEFTWVQNSDGSYCVVDLRGLEGTDTLLGVDFLQFSDQLIALTTSGTDVPDEPSPPVLVNEAPLTHNDSYTTARNTKLTVGGTGVLANDSDPEGQALSALVVSKPTGGSLSLASDGSFVYTPRKNFSGTDTFTYNASDGVNVSLATVSIVVGGGATTPKGGNGKGQSPDYHVDYDDHGADNLPPPSVQLDGSFASGLYLHAAEHVKGALHDWMWT